VRAVVFDCDGVLADSEPHSRYAWLDVIGPMGHPATWADVSACTGLGYGATWEVLDRIAPLPPQEELWPRVLAALARSFTKRRLARFEDAVDAVEHLALHGVPIAVASSSPRERVDLTLSHIGLSGRFEVTVSGDDVEHGKPAPDAYLAAAAGLVVEPGECLAVEDSGVGATAAVAAGMRVLGVAREPAEAGPLLAAGAALVDEIDGATLRAILG
jgi:HAD superfamily hydrolase (TIGR01509 family)